VLSLVGARQAGGVKKGADRGIDGRLIFFSDDKSGRKEKQIIFSVKGGGVQVKDVRDLRGVIDREKAQIGVLITLDPKLMRGPSEYQATFLFLRLRRAACEVRF
jgi:site-specific DNA-methyltransferase (adenine-specific)